MNARGSAASVGSRGYTARMAGARAAMRPARIASGSPTASQASPARQRPSPSPRSRGVSPARRQAASTGITARSSAEAAKWSGGGRGAPVKAEQRTGERRVGEEGRYRGGAGHLKKKKIDGRACRGQTAGAPKPRRDGQQEHRQSRQIAHDECGSKVPVYATRENRVPTRASC